MRKVVSIIYLHHLELFTTTDYGIRLSLFQPPKTRTARFNKSFVVYALFYFFCICFLLYFIVLYFIFTYILLYLYKLLFVSCSAFELPVLINLS